MTTETALLISVASLAFAMYQGLTNIKRNQKADDRMDATQLTTVIVKLENIGAGISDIKTEIGNVKTDVKEDRGRIIKLEENAKEDRAKIVKLEEKVDALEKESKNN